MVKYLVWTSLHNRIDTNDFLLIFGPYLTLSPDLCVLCKSSSEMEDHLLKRYKVAPLWQSCQDSRRALCVSCYYREFFKWFDVKILVKKKGLRFNIQFIACVGEKHFEERNRPSPITKVGKVLPLVQYFYGPGDASLTFRTSVGWT